MPPHLGSKISPRQRGLFYLDLQRQLDTLLKLSLLWAGAGVDDLLKSLLTYVISVLWGLGWGNNMMLPDFQQLMIKKLHASVLGSCSCSACFSKVLIYVIYSSKAPSNQTGTFSGDLESPLVSSGSVYHFQKKTAVCWPRWLMLGLVDILRSHLILLLMQYRLGRIEYSFHLPVLLTSWPSAVTELLVHLPWLITTSVFFQHRYLCS